MLNKLGNLENLNLNGLKLINENGEIQSFSKITSESKKKRAIAATALRLAKLKHDPLFKKSMQAKSKWQGLTKKIQSKYHAQAVQDYTQSKRNKK